MNRLYSYTIPIDDGAAPNPFWGVCTLAICKPAIRRTAKVGDWVVGLGSVDAPSGNLSGKIVYAMRVDFKKTMEEYDELTKTELKKKVPNVDSENLIDRLGDSIYDFEGSSPKLRKSVHDDGNIKTDLGGKSVLLSKHFYYFGHNAIDLDDRFEKIIHQQSGHKSNANQDNFEEFVEWIDGLELKVGQLYGWPDFPIEWTENSCSSSCAIRKEDNENDEIISAC